MVDSGRNNNAGNPNIDDQARGGGIPSLSPTNPLPQPHRAVSANRNQDSVGAAVEYEELECPQKDLYATRDFLRGSKRAEIDSIYTGLSLMHRVLVRMPEDRMAAMDKVNWKYLDEVEPLLLETPEVSSVAHAISLFSAVGFEVGDELKVPGNSGGPAGLDGVEAGDQTVEVSEENQIYLRDYNISNLGKDKAAIYCALVREFLSLDSSEEYTKACLEWKERLDEAESVREETGSDIAAVGAEEELEFWLDLFRKKRENESELQSDKIPGISAQEERFLSAVNFLKHATLDRGFDILNKGALIKDDREIFRDFCNQQGEDVEVELHMEDEDVQHRKLAELNLNKTLEERKADFDEVYKDIDFMAEEEKEQRFQALESIRKEGLNKVIDTFYYGALNLLDPGIDLFKDTVLKLDHQAIVMQIASSLYNIEGRKPIEESAELYNEFKTVVEERCGYLFKTVAIPEENKHRIKIQNSKLEAEQDSFYKKDALKKVFDKEAQQEQEEEKERESTEKKSTKKEEESTEKESTEKEEESAEKESTEKESVSDYEKDVRAKAKLSAQGVSMMMLEAEKKDHLTSIAIPKLLYLVNNIRKGVMLTLDEGKDAEKDKETERYVVEEIVKTLLKKYPSLAKDMSWEPFLPEEERVGDGPIIDLVSEVVCKDFAAIRSNEMPPYNFENPMVVALAASIANYDEKYISNEELKAALIADAIGESTNEEYNKEVEDAIGGIFDYGRDEAKAFIDKDKGLDQDRKSIDDTPSAILLAAIVSVLVMAIISIILGVVAEEDRTPDSRIEHDEATAEDITTATGELERLEMQEQETLNTQLVDRTPISGDQQVIGGPNDPIADGSLPTVTVEQRYAILDANGNVLGDNFYETQAAADAALSEAGTGTVVEGQLTQSVITGINSPTGGTGGEVIESEFEVNNQTEYHSTQYTETDVAGNTYKVNTTTNYNDGEINHSKEVITETIDGKQNIQTRTMDVSNSGVTVRTDLAVDNTQVSRLEERAFNNADDTVVQYTHYDGNGVSEGSSISIVNGEGEVSPMKGYINQGGTQLTGIYTNADGTVTGEVFTGAKEDIANFVGESGSVSNAASNIFPGQDNGLVGKENWSVVGEEVDAFNNAEDAAIASDNAFNQQLRDAAVGVIGTTAVLGIGGSIAGIYYNYEESKKDATSEKDKDNSEESKKDATSEKDNDNSKEANQEDSSGKNATSFVPTKAPATPEIYRTNNNNKEI